VKKILQTAFIFRSLLLAKRKYGTTGREQPRDEKYSEEKRRCVNTRWCEIREPQGVLQCR